jgi:hypothetical protein
MFITWVYIMLKAKDQTQFMKMKPLQHYRLSIIKFVLLVCISKFQNNWKFMKLCTSILK